MKRKKYYLIIPVVVILLFVHVQSRFSSVEDNLKFQYGTPIAEVEMIDGDNQTILFTMDDSLGLTRYKTFLNYYIVEDDYGHEKPSGKAFVKKILMDDKVYYYGYLDYDVDEALFTFVIDDKKLTRKVILKDKYFYISDMKNHNYRLDIEVLDHNILLENIEIHE